jgi:hypothetical protein
VPFPEQLQPLLRRCIDGRADGPLLRQRSIAEGLRRPRLAAGPTQAIFDQFQRALQEAQPGEVQAAQDGKQLFRRLLRQMGGVSVDSLAKEFKGLLAAAGTRFYDLRGSVNTDMNTAGVSELFQLYVTGHSLDEKILSRYVSLKLVDEMQHYFRHIQPLLDAIEDRAGYLGLV